MNEFSTDALLTESEIIVLGRLKVGLDRIKEATERLNALAIETGFSLRLLDTIPAALMSNDIAVIIVAHEHAENAVRDAAFAAAGLVAPDLLRRAA